MKEDLPQAENTIRHEAKSSLTLLTTFFSTLKSIKNPEEVYKFVAKYQEPCEEATQRINTALDKLGIQNP